MHDTKKRIPPPWKILLIISLSLLAPYAAFPASTFRYSGTLPAAITNGPLTLEFDLFSSAKATNVLASAFMTNAVISEGRRFDATLTFNPELASGLRRWLAIHIPGQAPSSERRQVLVATNGVLADLPDPTWYSYAMLAIGVLTVTFFSLTRFNTPPTNRASTTASRYWIGALFYTAAALVAYFILLVSPQAFRVVQNDSQGLPELVNELATPLGVALVLTVFLPNVPILSRVDEQIRERFQAIAEIPAAARILCQRLTDAEFRIPEALKGKVTELMRARQFDQEDVSFEPGRGHAQLWTKIVYFLLIVIQQRKDDKFRAFHRRFPGDYDNLKEQYDDLEGRALDWFKEFRQSDPQNDRRLQHIQNDFVKDAEALLLKIYKYISQALLRSQFSDSARTELLHTIGFSTSIPQRQLTLNQLAALFLLVELVLLLCFVLMRPYTPAESDVQMIGKVVMIGLIYLVAVASAIYPKEYWAFAKRKPGEERPWVSYIASGFIGLASAFVVNLVYNLLIEGGATGPAWDNVRLKYPYLLSAVVTASTTAWAIDNRLKQGSEETVQRLSEGAIQGILAGFAGWGVHAMLVDSYKTMTHSATNVPGTIWIAAVFAVVGFIIGFCIPHWWRIAKQKAQE